MSAANHIVFFHRNWNWYLPYVLRQARAACPAAQVVLVGQSAVRGFPLDPLERYEAGARAQAFRRVYRHMSPNPEKYELFCFLRWFYLLDFMEANGVERALHLDSDFLLYGTLEELEATYPIPPGGAAYCIPDQDHASFAWHASAHVGLFTLEALRDFCAFATATFSEERWMEQYRVKVEAQRGLGGINDMTTLYLFWRQRPERITNLSEVRGGAVLDHNVNLALNQHEGEYQLRDGLKRLEFPDGKATLYRADGTPVRALGVHFQGAGKLRIPEFYRGAPFPGQALGGLYAGYKRTKRRLKQWVRGR